MTSKADPAPPSKGSERVVFVSDVHLYFGGDAYRDRFVDFLEERARGAAEILIHGDLFDFYLGPRQGRLPFYEPVFAALARRVEEGSRVVVLHGNRDFQMGAHFRSLGVQVIADEVALELGGQRVVVSHGDEYCIHDHSYQFWARGVLRAGIIRWLVRNLPVSVGVALAKTYRRISSRKTRKLQSRVTGRLPTILDGVTERLARSFADVVICGHIHWLAETPIEVEGKKTRLLTTGAWEDAPNYIEADGGFFRIWRLQPDGWTVYAPEDASAA